MPIPAGPGTTDPVDFAELRQHLGFKATNNDPELGRFLAVAESAVSTKLQTPLVPVARTDRLDGGSDFLVLKAARAVSLTSAAYLDGTTIDLAGLDLDPASGIVYLTTGYCFTRGRRNVLITYLAGWATLPPDVVHAIKELVRHLWETQRPNAISNRPGSIDEATPVVAGSYASWPTRIQELLNPYIPVTVA